MKVKLSVFTLEDLERLEKELKVEIQQRKERIKLARETERQAAGPFDLAPEARFIHPMRPNLQWTGRGRMPTWMSELIESGYRKEDLRVI